jgi:hypothetical protein
MTPEDKKLAEEVLTEPGYKHTISFSYQKNGVAVSEYFSTWAKTYKELEDSREFTLKKIPSTTAFPDDEGPIATAPENTVQATPVCGVHKIPMKLRPAGTSRNGSPYPAFWACTSPAVNGIYCKYRPPVEVKL